MAAQAQLHVVSWGIRPEALQRQYLGSTQTPLLAPPVKAGSAPGYGSQSQGLLQPQPSLLIKQVQGQREQQQQQQQHLQQQGLPQALQGIGQGEQWGPWGDYEECGVADFGIEEDGQAKRLEAAAGCEACACQAGEEVGAGLCNVLLPGYLQEGDVGVGADTLTGCCQQQQQQQQQQQEGCSSSWGREAGGIRASDRPSSSRGMHTGSLAHTQASSSGRWRRVIGIRPTGVCRCKCGRGCKHADWHQAHRCVQAQM